MFRAQRRCEKTRTDTAQAVLPVSPGFLVRSLRVCYEADATGWWRGRTGEPPDRLDDLEEILVVRQDTGLQLP